METIDTVIVGAGQAGLATSYHLSQLEHEHIVLEQAAQPAHVWRDERWDSFTLVTPNWATRMPGAPYAGPHPDGFTPRDEIIPFFARYIEQFQLPVRCHTRVLTVVPREGGYLVATSDGDIAARNVVIATGFFQRPRVPAFAAALSPQITQLPSSQYRNPQLLPPGGVLVVGSAQSGCQIAEELRQAGRDVFLCTGSAGRVPRRYRGKDIIAWLELIGLFDLTPEQLPPGMSKFSGIPHFSGRNGGHTINLHQFARDGITLLGHLRGASGRTLFIAPDLHENLAQVDQFEREVVQMIDGYIAQHHLAAPPEELPELHDGYAQPIREHLDLHAAGITSVIWAMGYTFDYSLVHAAVCDSDGFPIQERGLTALPGLGFVGIPWMPTEKSGFLLGIGEATAHMARGIAGLRRLCDYPPSPLSPS